MANDITRAEALRLFSYDKRLSSNSLSGLKGVRFTKGAYEAHISWDGKFKYLGRFASPEQAHDAYVAAAKKVFGEFARAA